MEYFFSEKFELWLQYLKPLSISVSVFILFIIIKFSLTHQWKGQEAVSLETDETTTTGTMMLAKRSMYASSPLM